MRWCRLSSWRSRRCRTLDGCIITVHIICGISVYGPNLTLWRESKKLYSTLVATDELLYTSVPHGRLGRQVAWTLFRHRDVTDSILIMYRGSRAVGVDTCCQPLGIQLIPLSPHRRARCVVTVGYRTTCGSRYLGIVQRQHLHHHARQPSLREAGKLR